MSAGAGSLQCQSLFWLDPLIKDFLGGPSAGEAHDNFIFL